MSLIDPGDHPRPDLATASTLARLPLAEAEEGPLFCRKEPHDRNDACFAAWDAPLVWHHQKSQVKVDHKWQGGTKSVHFAFEERVPEEVWSKSWNMWYDHALMLREQTPEDIILRGTFGMEEVSTCYGADNVDRARPWVGLVARMQDLRRYYFLTLEYPGRIVLYRRDDRQWIEVAHAQVHLDVWVEYELTWRLDGQTMWVWLGDQFLFTATDYAYGGGWAGMRATCTAFCTEMTVAQAPEQVAPSERAAARRRIEAPPAKLPNPYLARELDLTALGDFSKSVRHPASIQAGRFSRGDGPAEILVRLFNRDDGVNYALVDLEGEVLWTAVLPGVELVLATHPDATGRSDILAIASDTLYRVDGRTGAIVNQVAAPVAPDGKPIRAGNGPRAMADLDGDGRREAFFLTCGCNDKQLWAYDDELNPLWYVETLGGQGHGGHLSVCDVDGDGKEEIHGGLCLLGSDGAIRWRQEEIARRLKCPNGHHVDSTEMGFFDGPDAPPTVHLQCSSAGHVVLDARTGALLAAHPQGHTQSGAGGRVIPGEEGVQVFATNRWGSYGVSAVYSGDGRRLARFQAGFTYQNMIPVNWDGSGLEYLLVLDGMGYRGIYDHRGRRLVDLDAYLPYDDSFQQRYDRTAVVVAPLVDGPCDDILIRLGSKLVIVSAKRAFPEGATVYAPLRRNRVSWPAWITIGQKKTAAALIACFD